MGCICLHTSANSTSLSICCTALCLEVCFAPVILGFLSKTLLITQLQYTCPTESFLSFLCSFSVRCVSCSLAMEIFSFLRKVTIFFFYYYWTGFLHLLILNEQKFSGKAIELLTYHVQLFVKAYT